MPALPRNGYSAVSLYVCGIRGVPSPTRRTLQVVFVPKNVGAVRNNPKERGSTSTRIRIPRYIANTRCLVQRTIATGETCTASTAQQSSNHPQSLPTPYPTPLVSLSRASAYSSPDGAHGHVGHIQLRTLKIQNTAVASYSNSKNTKIRMLVPPRFHVYMIVRTRTLFHVPCSRYHVRL